MLARVLGASGTRPHCERHATFLPVSTHQTIRFSGPSRRRGERAGGSGGGGGGWQEGGRGAMTGDACDPSYLKRSNG